MSPQELSNVIYSYYKSENAAHDILSDLRPTVLANIHKYKPIELCQVLNAFTECGLMDEELIEIFTQSFKSNFESMNPMDCAMFYYCFTKLGFVGHGRFYKYLQKSVSKTIRAFEGPHLRLMFYQFDQEEKCRLNRGVRGRLIEHCKYLIR